MGSVPRSSAWMALDAARHSSNGVSEATVVGIGTRVQRRSERAEGDRRNAPGAVGKWGGGGGEGPMRV
jgi:hypothetical protein